MKKGLFSRSWPYWVILFSVLLSSLSWSQCPQGDLNGDCRVDLDDFSLLSSQWLLSYDQNDFVLLCSQWQSPPQDPDGLEFVTIPAGSFQMGDPFNEGGTDERPVHTVTLSSFQMSKHEITNAQFAQFLNAARAQNKLKVVNGVIYAITDSSNSQPWCDTSTSSSYSQTVISGGGYSVKTRDGRSQVNDPVVCVSWYGAKAFCDFYGYKLPTEAQWEYAARGGLSGQRFPWGTNINHSYANYRANGSAYTYDTSPYTTYTYHPTYNTGTYPYTSPVGSFAANGYGLYDMSGNVWEWCSDWYGAYSSASQSNPSGPTTGSNRVLSGGSWTSVAGICRVAGREWYIPGNRNYCVGFRVCR